MGGGRQHAEDAQGTAAPSPPPRLFRHRRRCRAPPLPADTGIDSPPSVTCPSLRHQPCKLSIRTSQYLCTLIHPPCANREEDIPAGTAPCDPIIAFGRYVVSATDDGRVCFYSIHHQQDPCRPSAIVEVDVYSFLTGLVAVPEGVSLVRYRSTTNKERLLKPPDFLGHVVAVTSDGDVHILECSNNGRVKKLFSWNTGTCNVSCVTVRPDRTGQWRISLGYESGSLEEWHVSIPVRERTTKEPTTTASNVNKVNTDKESETESGRGVQAKWMPLMRRVFAQHLYRGFFDLPIRSVSSLGCESNRDANLSMSINEDSRSEYEQGGMNTEETSMDGSSKEVVKTSDLIRATNEDNNIKDASKVEEKSKDTMNETDDKQEKIESESTMNDTRDYLSVCLVLNPRNSDESLGRPASSSQIEVIHVSKLEQDWTTMLREEEGHVRTKGTGALALALGDYCVWPSAGMEIRDTSSLPANDSEGQRRLSRKIRGLPSHGSDRMCTFLALCR